MERVTRDIRLTLIGKPGCHLCDDARVVVQSVMAEIEATDAASRMSLEEQSILDDADLAARYAEEIPVVLVDGIQRDFWKIDEARLERVLQRAMAQ